MRRQLSKTDTPLTPLKTARHRHGLTLRQVVQVVGTTVGHISRIENGYTIPRRKLAAKLVALFSPDLHELHLFYPERYLPSPKPSADATA